MIRLIYCLNSIVDRYPFAQYNSGFPRPAQAIRDLERIRGLCHSAGRASNSLNIGMRLSELSRHDATAFHLLRFRFARQICPSDPTSILAMDDTSRTFFAFAGEQPSELAAFCDDAIAVLRPLKGTGRGGSRRVPATDTRFIIEQLGLYYEWLTGNPPGATFDPESNRSTEAYTGPFIELCREVFNLFGRSMNGRQVFEVLRSVDIQHWIERREPFKRNNPL